MRVNMNAPPQGVKIRNHITSNTVKTPLNNRFFILGTLLLEVIISQHHLFIHLKRNHYVLSRFCYANTLIR